MTRKLKYNDVEIIFCAMRAGIETVTVTKLVILHTPDEYKTNQYSTRQPILNSITNYTRVSLFKIVNTASCSLVLALGYGGSMLQHLAVAVVLERHEPVAGAVARVDVDLVLCTLLLQLLHSLQGRGSRRQVEGRESE